MALSAGRIISIVVALLLIGILLPIGVGTVATETSNGTGLLAMSTGNTTIDTLVPVIAIMAAIGLMMAFVPRGNKD